MSESIRKRVGTGIAWTTGARLAVRGLGLVSTVILARLLEPADFGIVAMATSLVALLELASAFSFDITLIQSRDSSRDEYDTAWTLNVAFAAALALLLAALAPAAARFYSEPRLEAVVYAFSVAFAVQGFQNIGVVAFRRDLEFHKDFALMVAQKAVSFLLTVPLAFWLRNYWALVVGSVASAFASVALSYLVHPFRPRLALSATRRLFGFSAWLMVQNLVNFVRHRTAEFTIGRLGGASSLGLFGVAYEIANLPTNELVAPINRAVFPGYARIAHDHARLRGAFVDVLAWIAVLILPVAFGIAAVADPLVAVLLGPRWSAAAPLIGVLAITGALAVLQTNTGSVYNALALPRYMVLTGIIHMAFLVPALVWATWRWGAMGAAWAFLVHGIVIGAPSTFLILVRTTPVTWGDIRRPVWRPLVAAVVMFAVVRTALGTIGPGWLSALAALAGGIAVGAATYAVVLMGLWIVARRPAGAERALLDGCRRMLGQRGASG